MRATLLVALLAWALGGTAQTTPMFKCTDAQRRITYSNTPCDKLGLKDLGQVEDRTMTMPLAAPAQKPAPKPEAPKPAADGEPERGGAQVKPVAPLLEKLTK